MFTAIIEFLFLAIIGTILLFILLGLWLSIFALAANAWEKSKQESDDKK